MLPNRYLLQQANGLQIMKEFILKRKEYAVQSAINTLLCSDKGRFNRDKLTINDKSYYNGTYEVLYDGDVVKSVDIGML